MHLRNVSIMYYIIIYILYLVPVTCLLYRFVSRLLRIFPRIDAIIEAIRNMIWETGDWSQSRINCCSGADLIKGGCYRRVFSLYTLSFDSKYYTEFWWILFCWQTKNYYPLILHPFNFISQYYNVRINTIYFQQY